LWGVIKHLFDSNVLDLLVGVFSLILVLALKRWLPLVPGSLVVVILSILSVYLFGWTTKLSRSSATSTLGYPHTACRMELAGETICRCSAQPWRAVDRLR
jgi:MFS superfamily sulfate permease-like transporter